MGELHDHANHGMSRVLSPLGYQHLVPLSLLTSSLVERFCYIYRIYHHSQNTSSFQVETNG